MKILTLVQKETASYKNTIQGVLEAYAQHDLYDCVHVAMAYASIAGARTLLGVFANRKIKQSQWLIGLDDVITQPGAIKLLMGLENAEVRIAGFADSSSRFHPKVVRFRSFNETKKELLMIGSANLTSNAFSGNSEAVVFLECESAEDKREFLKIWQELWSQGHTPTKDELSNYEAQYKTASKNNKKTRARLLAQRKTDKKPKKVFENDNAEIDPAHASICWIECGYITAMGRELEFKAEQGLFFGLEASGGHEKMFRFCVSDGSTISLKMKYQQNHMWRLQMNNNVPEVQQGLRPLNAKGALGRSDSVAVFTRTKKTDLFTLSFVKLNSQEFAKLKKKSMEFGTIGQTSARSYGWL